MSGDPNADLRRQYMKDSQGLLHKALEKDINDGNIVIIGMLAIGIGMLALIHESLEAK